MSYHPRRPVLSSRAARRPPPRRRPATVPARARFRSLDSYRVEREWRRYEGNALRDLFRDLRVRFLLRHPPSCAGPVLEIGPGPGRFSPYLGDAGHPRVLLDLSSLALRAARRHLRGRAPPAAGRSEFLRGDALHPPVRSGSCAEVTLLGNTVGFGGSEALPLLHRVADLVAPGGTLLVETVAGAGGVSRYLSRFPGGALRRLLAAPPRAVLPRIEGEGFADRPLEGPADATFRRMGAREVADLLGPLGFQLEEVVAVAPTLGADPGQVEAVRPDPKAWAHLLEIEERLGVRIDRQERAAALLLAARRRAKEGTAPSEG